MLGFAIATPNLQITTNYNILFIKTMHYLKDSVEIKKQITQFTSAKTLWLDTEIADWYTYAPRLSLIQVLAVSDDCTGEHAYLLDVLDKPDLADFFINQIMLNSQIEKVFHNASFDLKYLGEKLALNITCTLKLARKIKKKLSVTNLKLKTLAVELCNFSQVDLEEQSSDWGKRPLTQKQLKYAAMDTVYLAAVHRCLLKHSNLETVSNNIFNMPSHDLKQPSTQESISISATKVRLAFECPRLFYLHHHFGGNSLFLPPDSRIAIGNVFHNLADDFIDVAIKEPKFKELFNPEPSLLNVGEISLQMQQIFYQLKFSSYLENAVAKDVNQAKPMFHVWQGLRGLIKRFAEILVSNRSYCSPERLISNTFILEDRKLEHYFQLSDGTKQKVVGRLDCLVFNFEVKQLCVIEYKTYQPADPSAQLAQVALYSYMLWQKNKVAVDCAVYCVLPEFKEYHYTWEQLENTVHQLIPRKLQQMQQWLSWQQEQDNPPPATTQPNLCKICPQREKCQTYFASLPASNNQEDSENQTKQQNDVDVIGKNLVTTLSSFGIDVNYLGVLVAPSFIRVKLKPQLGVKVNAILKLSADLQVQLGLQNPPLIAPQAGYVSVDLPRQDRQVAKFENYLESTILQNNAPVKIAIGVNLEGQLVEADLSDPNTCHFLVGGTTGSGKSEFLRSLLLSLLVRHSPQHLKIALVDPKRVTFPEFEKMRWLYSPVAKDGESTVELMESLVAQMENRYQQFEKTGCNDLSTYNQRSQTPLPRIVCIFDEYADFMAEKELRKTLELSIKRLGAMARAAGIHLIIATQRPEATIVTPIIRSNLPGRVALKTASEADSTIVLGGKQTAAANLLGKGDLLYLIGANMQRLQSLLVTNIQLHDK
jgi:DNA segregation ATPase FtsK/SpoIIIE, S-DNA-T family